MEWEEERRISQAMNPATSFQSTAPPQVKAPIPKYLLKGALGNFTRGSTSIALLRTAGDW